MPKSLEKLCIRQWRLQLRGMTGSLNNPHWRGYPVRKFCRTYGVISAACIIEREAEDRARREWQSLTGLNEYSPESVAWYREHRLRFENEARIAIENGDSDVDVEEDIREEIDHWCS